MFCCSKNHCKIYCLNTQCTINSSAKESKPQTLLFSATLPPWVLRTAKKYMSEDRKIVDLIGDQELKASETIEVRRCACTIMLRFHCKLNFYSF